MKQAGTSATTMTVIHTVPDMSDEEREKTKRMIGNDLYEIFLRIQARLDNDNEFLCS